MWVDKHLGREVEITVDDTVLVVRWENRVIVGGGGGSRGGGTGGE